MAHTVKSVNQKFIPSQNNSVFDIVKAKKKQLESVNKSLDNLLNAIQMGIFTESTKQRLEELEHQKKNLEEQIAEVSSVFAL